MTLLPVAVALAAAATAFLVTPLVIRFAHARELYCLPDIRRIHDRPVPRLGGVAVVVGVGVGLAIALLLAPSSLAGPAEGDPGLALLGLLLGSGIALGVGLVDDVQSIRPLPKLLAQIAAALIAYKLGFRIEELSWAGASAPTIWLSLPLTVLWIVGVTNAYNLVDGMDGLATGMGIIAFGATMAAAVLLGHGAVVVVSAALLGALIGFLPHNFNRAKIFLGDSGSLFIGFVLAVLSVQGSMKSSTAVLVAVPLFALAIPLLDTLVAMARRWLRGVPISRADSHHIHHRLLAVGFSGRDAVMVLYLLAASFAGFGILIAFAPAPKVGVIAVLGGAISAVVLIAGMRRLGYDEFLLAGKVLASGPRRVREVVRGRILASDLAAVIAVARSLEEIQAVLSDAGPDLGLVHMEVCSDGASPGAWLGGSKGERVYRLDYPLSDDPDPLVLRMRVGIADELRPAGAERIAHILGPAIGSRLEELDVGYRPARVPHHPQHASKRQAAVQV